LYVQKAVKPPPAMWSSSRFTAFLRKSKNALLSENVSFLNVLLFSLLVCFIQPVSVCAAFGTATASSAAGIILANRAYSEHDEYKQKQRYDKCSHDGSTPFLTAYALAFAFTEATCRLDSGRNSRTSSTSRTSSAITVPIVKTPVVKKVANWKIMKATA